MLELERTSGSVGGTPAVAVSGIYASGVPQVNTCGIPNYKLGGGGGGGSSLVNYAISARKAKTKLESYSLHGEEWQSRRIRRFYQRYFTGVGVGGRLRFLTLTSSDEALASGKDIHKAFRALVMRLRRRFGQFEYMGVKEEKMGRQHLHLVFRGGYMEQAVISAMWQEVYKSRVVDIRAVRGCRGGAQYLAKYLAKGIMNRYWASYGWVFRGWVGWSKLVNKVRGSYPHKRVLQVLARLDLERRLAAMWFLCPWAMLDYLKHKSYNTV